MPLVREKICFFINENEFGENREVQQHVICIWAADCNIQIMRKERQNVPPMKQCGFNVHF